MKIYPQQSLIVVEPIPNEDTTLIIPDMRDEEGKDTDKPNEALRLRVIEVGPGRTLDNGTVIPVPLKVGDEVVCDFKFAMQLLPPSWYGGGMKWIVDYAGVVAVIKRDPDEKVSRFHVPQAKPEPKASIYVPQHMAKPAKELVH